MINYNILRLFIINIISYNVYIIVCFLYVLILYNFILHKMILYKVTALESAMYPFQTKTMKKGFELTNFPFTEPSAPPWKEATSCEYHSFWTIITVIVRVITSHHEHWYTPQHQTVQPSMANCILCLCCAPSALSCAADCTTFSFQYCTWAMLSLQYQVAAFWERAAEKELEKEL